MLIRLVVENLLSFGRRKEFSLLANTKLKTLKNHIIKKNIDILRLGTIYGANGAGKSNLIKSLELFRTLIVNDDNIFEIIKSKFKFSGPDENQILAVEFVQDNIPFYYAIEIKNDRISTEELYISGLGQTKDELIYERKTDSDNSSKIKFLNEFEEDAESRILKEIILKEFVQKDKPILRLLANRENKFLEKTKSAFKWFNQTLLIVTPYSKPSELPHRIDVDSDFKHYMNDIIKSLNIGISEINTEKQDLKKLTGNTANQNTDKIIKDIENSNSNMIGIRNNHEEILFTKEGDNYFVKRLKIGHSGGDEPPVYFNLDEESDGTIRLIELLPAIKSVISESKVLLIDEIERSIHPVLIKELVTKISNEKGEIGQLIFTTHESNLLDQNLFRKDEIWFVEKNKSGETDLYSFNDFKEHKTIDIQKGYLNGRYGSIPFLRNLEELNWHKYDSTN